MFVLLTARLKQARKLHLWRLRSQFEVIEVGAFMPRMSIVPELNVGDVGFIVAGIKNVKDTRVGDTVTDAKNPALKHCQAIVELIRWFSADCIQLITTEYNDLREALGEAGAE